MHPTEADLVSFRSCFAANGIPKDLDALRWQYLGSAEERLFVDLSVDDAGEGEQIAGIYAVHPVRFRVGGEIRDGAQSLDTLTDARYRGRGLFVDLARSVYARLEAAGFALVYGFPNASSAPGFNKHLAWLSLDPVPLLCRPLRTRYFLNRVPRVGRVLGALPDVRLPLPAAPRLPPGAAIRPLDAFDERTDALWDTFAREVGVAVQRDRGYLEWRLRRKPHEEYRTYAYHRGGEVAGFVSYSLKDRHGGRVGYVMEALYDPRQPEVGEALLRFVVREMAERGADAALAWNFDHSPNHAAFRRTGFRLLPERVRPSELHFGVRPLAAADAALLAERSSWYISFCDSDTD
jgi:hypothetical protein